MTEQERRLITMVSAAYMLAESDSPLEDALGEAVDAALRAVGVEPQSVEGIDVNGRGLQFASRVRSELAAAGKAGGL